MTENLDPEADNRDGACDDCAHAPGYHDADREAARVRKILATEVDEAGRLHDDAIDRLRDAGKAGDFRLASTVADTLRTIETRLSVACRLYEEIVGEVASPVEIAEALR